MTELLIQKETFSIANSLKDIFENRLHNVYVLSEGDENNAEGKQVPGYFLLNASLEYTVPRANADAAGFSTSIFFEGRNLLDTNFETGGILAENEVDGTGEAVELLLRQVNHSQSLVAWNSHGKNKQVVLSLILII